MTRSIFFRWPVDWFAFAAIWLSMKYCPHARTKKYYGLDVGSVGWFETHLKFFNVMKKYCAVLLMALLAMACQTKSNKTIQWRLTTPDQSNLFASQTEIKLNRTQPMLLRLLLQLYAIKTWMVLVTRLQVAAQLINALPDSTKINYCANSLLRMAMVWVSVFFASVLAHPI